jgi:hypothetical protein
MLKWLSKFMLEVAPPVAATLIGAFLVHQLWPSGEPDPQHAATPPAAQVSTDAAKPAGTPRAISTKSADTSATPEAPATATNSSSIGKSARQSSETAKVVSNPPLPVTRDPSVLERAERALEKIPLAKSGSSATAPQSSPPGRTTRAPAAETAVVAPPSTTPVPPPESAAIEAPAAGQPANAAATAAVVPPVGPPPMDPPREIKSSASAAAVPSAPPAHAAYHDNNPLRVNRSDRANLADIPSADGDDVVPAQETAAVPPPPDQSASTTPPREKNIVENILGSLHSVLPERMR